MKKLDQQGIRLKGTFSSYSIFSSIFTGGTFSLIGSMLAPKIYLDRLILTAFGCFMAHWILTHSFHDLFHYSEKERKEMSTSTARVLKIFIISSAIFLFCIAVYLALKAGWMVIVFTIIGACLCMYAKPVFYHEIMYALAGSFALLGSFYVQTSYFGLDVLTLKVLFMAMFAFFTCYGWISLYHLDHYGWTAKGRNRGLALAKLGIPFLILTLLIDKIIV